MTISGFEFVLNGMEYGTIMDLLDKIRNDRKENVSKL